MLKIPESQIQKTIHQSAPLYKCELYRNNVGGFLAIDLNGRSIKTTIRLLNKIGFIARWVKAGLCKGSSDLIGYRKVIITSDMIGKEIAIFTAIEVKKSDWKNTKRLTETEEDQKQFINNIKENGGIAGFANSQQEFVNIIEKKL